MLGKERKRGTFLSRWFSYAPNDRQTTLLRNGLSPFSSHSPITKWSCHTTIQRFNTSRRFLFQFVFSKIHRISTTPIDNSCSGANHFHSIPRKSNIPFWFGWNHCSNFVPSDSPTEFDRTLLQSDTFVKFHRLVLISHRKSGVISVKLRCKESSDKQDDLTPIHCFQRFLYVSSFDQEGIVEKSCSLTITLFQTTGGAQVDAADREVGTDSIDLVVAFK